MQKTIQGSNNLPSFIMCKKIREKTLYFCKPCEKLFETQNIAEQHHRIAHGHGTKLAKNSRPVSKLPSKNLNQTVYKCELCLKYFAGYEARSRHIEKVHSPSSPTFKSHLSPQQLPKEIPDEKETFKCAQCDKRYSQKCNLRRHILTAHSRSGGKFSVQNVKLKQSWPPVEKTQDDQDDGADGSPCEFCKKRFRFKSQYRKHILTHTGLKPFKCSFCSRDFSQKANMQRHERIHTGEKPFECVFCLAKFHDQSHWKVHVKGHQNSGLVVGHGKKRGSNKNN